jgi:hypothetical protein
MVKLVVKSYKYNLGGEYSITSDGTNYIFTRGMQRIVVPKTNSNEIDGIDGIDDLIQAEQTAPQTTTTSSWNPLSWFQGTKKGGRRRKATHRRVKKVRRRSRKN